MGFRTLPVKAQVSGVASSLAITLNTHAIGDVIVLVIAQDVGGDRYRSGCNGGNCRLDDDRNAGRFLRLTPAR